MGKVLSVIEAVDVLRQGQIVGLPTETVYGLGADATNESPNERLASVPCKFVMPSRRKFEPNCSEPGSGRGFFSKYDLSMSLTFEPDKSLVSILDKTLSLKKEAKSSNKAKKIRFMLVKHLHSLK